MMFHSEEIDNPVDFEGVIEIYNYFSIAHNRNN